ncbi:MAG TPA: TlpA family protein disulfide reductase, partial [Sphingomonadaceae bacterium]|nr:TlpA family protein disulfide reductase [Sphingomonadaceae bacterium]
MIPAPELDVAQWFNTPTPLTLAGLRGKVVALHAFQMLCPGCVAEGLPQAKRMARLFDPARVAVIGLHTVFEH